MHYRHSYHAGNFADVFKHLLLVGLLQALNRKDKPWFFLDTHAGAGRYDLAAESAAATAEWRDGIGRLAALRAEREPLATYLALARHDDPESPRHWYPGSPLVALKLARAGDRLAFCEKVEQVAGLLDDLRRITPVPASAAVHLRDGYEAASLLPPPEKRGLVLIDPPFEAPDEFEHIGDFLKTAQARFAQGQYAVWYPVKKRFDADRFLRRVGRDSTRPVLDLRFDNGAPSEGQMHACGLLVINPPYRYDQDMRGPLDLLRRELSQGPKPSSEIRWIKTEEQCKS